jgi:hypothetical protein
MNKFLKTLEMLRPEGGYVSRGFEYENIEFIDCEPFTKAQFEAALNQFDNWKLEQDAKAQADKTAAQSKLAALGLTADDLKALGL